MQPSRCPILRDSPVSASQVLGRHYEPLLRLYAFLQLFGKTRLVGSSGDFFFSRRHGYALLLWEVCSLPVVLWAKPGPEFGKISGAFVFVTQTW